MTTTLWRTCYRGHDDKAVRKDHDTETDALRHAESLVNRAVVLSRQLVYVYPIDIEEEEEVA